MIAMTIKDLREARLNPLGAYSSTYTHCEVHPSMILGEALCTSWGVEGLGRSAWRGVGEEWGAKWSEERGEEDG